MVEYRVSRSAGLRLEIRILTLPREQNKSPDPVKEGARIEQVVFVNKVTARGLRYYGY